MLGAGDYVERGLLAAGQPALEGEHAGRGGAQGGGVEQATAGRLQERAAHRGLVSRHAAEQQQIHPGRRRRDGLDGQGRALVDGAHVHGVADDHAAEAHLLAQQAAQDGRGEGGGQVGRAGERGSARCAVMTRRTSAAMAAAKGGSST